MMRVIISFILLLTFLSSCSVEKLYTMKQRSKVNAFEQIDFHDLMKRYLNKDVQKADELEGLYSVSMVVSKKGKGILSSSEKERITDRKENYLQVAILKDMETGNREYMEVPLDKKYLPSYSIQGEFSRMEDANILIYKKYESRGRVTAYTFTFDRTRNILEGVRKENNGQFEYTYLLTYVKLQTGKLESSRR